MSQMPHWSGTSLDLTITTGQLLEEPKKPAHDCVPNCSVSIFFP